MKDLAIRDILEPGSIDEKYYLKRDGLDEFVLENLSYDLVVFDSGLIREFVIPREMLKNHDSRRRIFSIEGKSPACLTSPDDSRILDITRRVRRFTPLEYERLQTVPEGYTNIAGTSDTQRYKMIGNGFTIRVISHILKGIL